MPPDHNEHEQGQCAPLGLKLKSEGPGNDPENDESKVGVCLSGGGMRSASWCLGAIQALKQERTWEKVDVVAAVSGGSYIAASHAIAVDKAQPDERTDADSPLVPPVYSRGSSEERFLRNRSSYLLVGNGVKWRAITSVLYGTLFGLGGLLLAIFVISRPIGWLYAASPLDWSGGYEAPSGWQVIVPVVLAGCAVVAIIAERWINTRPPPESKGTTRRRDAVIRLRGADRPQGERRWRGVSRLLVFLAVAAAVFLLVIPMLLGWLNDPDQENWVGSLISELSAGVGSGGDTANRPSIAVLVLLASLIGTVMKGVLGRKETRPMLFRVAAALILPLLLVFLSLKWIDGALAVAVDPQWTSGLPAPWALELGTLVTSVVLLELMWFFYDANRASLHPFYRERLSSAFVMRRRPDGVAEQIPYANPLPVTDLKSSPVRAEQIRPNGDPDGGRAGQPERRKKSRRPDHSTDDRATATHTPHQPVLVVVAAANVRDIGAVPPGREAVPFIFETCNKAPKIGIPADAHGVEKEELYGMCPAGLLQDLMPREVTLPAAMAISGAAFSPIMGTMDRPSLRLLMALFNLRLGLWLPNPYLHQGTDQGGGTPESRRTENKKVRQGGGSQDSGPSRKSERRPGYRYLWNEMRGHSSIKDDYLYVSDGGHYENLGLVELLRRGCTEIYCFDASGQAAGRLASLGHSMAIAKEELQVEFGDFAKPEFDPESGLTTNLSTNIPYHYTSDDGSRSHDGEHLIHYLPLGVEKDSPHDVREYQLEQIRDPQDDDDHVKQWRFPWDSIGDQVFDHRQFEAYRALGESATKHMLARQSNGNAAPPSSEKDPEGALAVPPSPP